MDDTQHEGAHVETMAYLLILTFVIAVVALTIALIALLQNLADRAALVTRVTAERFDADHLRLSRIEQQVSMFFSLVERRLSSMLHAPTHLAMDALLEKLRQQTITADECITLHRLLRERRDALVIEGLSRPDLQFPELFVLWALEVRILTGAPAGIEPPR